MSNLDQRHGPTHWTGQTQPNLKICRIKIHQLCRAVDTGDRSHHSFLGICISWTPLPYTKEKFAFLIHRVGLGQSRIQEKNIDSRRALTTSESDRGVK